MSVRGKISQDKKLLQKIAFKVEKCIQVTREKEREAAELRELVKVEKDRQNEFAQQLCDQKVKTVRDSLCVNQNMQTEIKRLHMLKDALEKQLADKDIEIGSQEKQNEELSGEIIELKEKLKESEQRCDEEHSKLGQSRKEVVGLKKNVVKMGKQTEKAKKMCEKLKKESSELKAEKQEMNLYTGGAKEREASLSSQNRILEADLKAAYQKLLSTEQSLKKEQEVEVGGLKKQFEEHLESEKTLLGKQHEKDIHSMKRKHVAALKKNTSAVDRAKKAKAAIEGKFEYLKNEAQQYELDQKKLEAEVESLRAQNSQQKEEFNTQIAVKSEHIEDLQNRIVDLQSEVEDEKKSREDLTNQIQLLSRVLEEEETRVNDTPPRKRRRVERADSPARTVNRVAPPKELSLTGFSQSAGYFEVTCTAQEAVNVENYKLVSTNKEMTLDKRVLQPGKNLRVVTSESTKLEEGNIAWAFGEWESEKEQIQLFNPKGQLIGETEVSGEGNCIIC